jgi:hypothetical protein
MQVCSGLQHDTDPARLKVLVQPLSDLLGEPLLHLWRGGEVLHQPGQLGQPQAPIAWQVAQVGDAREGQHVVFTDRCEGDLFG